LEPEKRPELANVRVWIGAGNHDPIIPPSETQRLVELLRIAGAEVTVRFLSAGHALTPADISLARDWLQKLGLPQRFRCCVSSRNWNRAHFDRNSLSRIFRRERI